MKKRQKIELESPEMEESADELLIPKVSFKRKLIYDVSIFTEKKFKGELCVCPQVLVEYLKDTELKVFLLILGDVRRTGDCIVRREEIATALDVSVVTISNAIKSLVDMGIVKIEQVGYSRKKTINFEAIQKLNDLLNGYLPGATRAFRKSMGDGDIRKPYPRALAILNLQYTKKAGDELESYD